MRLQIVARRPHLFPGNRPQSPAAHLRMPRQAAGDTADEIVDEKLVELPVEFAERGEQHLRQRPVGDHGLVDKGKADLLRRQAFHQKRRLHVEHAVMQARLRRRPAVMLLVGMQHDHLPRQAEAPFAAIGESLHAVQRHAERVGIVPVRLEHIARELRLDALDAGKGRRGEDAAALGRGQYAAAPLRFAQTFKTLEGPWR